MEIRTQREGYNGTSVPIRGAGIVVVGSGDTIFVATSAHVVAVNGTVDESITVAFRFEQGLRHAATVLAAEPNRDLAIVAVPGVGSRMSVLPMSHRGRTDKLDHGTEVFLLGCPDEQRCAEPSFDRASVTATDETGLDISVPNLPKGYSGGAVCADDGSVLGMVKWEGNVVTAHAVAIEEVLQFARWASHAAVTLRRPRWPLGGTPAYLVAETMKSPRVSGRGVDALGALQLRAMRRGDWSAELGYVVMLGSDLRLQAATQTLERRLRFSLGGGSGSRYREGRLEAAAGVLAPVAIYRRQSTWGYYVGEQAYTTSSGDYVFDGAAAAWHPVTIGTRVVGAGALVQMRAMLTTRSERWLPYSSGLVARYLWVPGADLSRWLIGLSTEVMR